MHESRPPGLVSLPPGDRFRIGRSARDIRGLKLAGFGIWIMSSGRRRFVICTRHGGRRQWTIMGDRELTGPGGGKVWRPRAGNGAVSPPCTAAGRWGLDAALRGRADVRAGEEARINASHSGGDSKLDRRRVDRSRQAWIDPRWQVGPWMESSLSASWSADRPGLAGVGPAALGGRPPANGEGRLHRAACPKDQLAQGSSGPGPVSSANRLEGKVVADSTSGIRTADRTSHGRPSRICRSFRQ